MVLGCQLRLPAWTVDGSCGWLALLGCLLGSCGAARAAQEQGD